jgi:exopolysaccharide production protein ExoZ
MVVVQHSSTFAGVVPGLWVHPAISHWLMGMRLGVAFFFVLSGIVMLTAHWEDVNRPESVPQYLWKRFRRIYPIYWIVLIPVVASQVVLATQPERTNPWVVVSSFLLVRIHSGFETNLVVAWTLFSEVLFYGVFAIALLNRRVGTVVFALWLGISALNVMHGPMVLEMLFSPLHLLFAMGMGVAWWLRRRKTRRPRALLAAGGIVLLASLVYGGWCGAASDRVYLWAGAGTALALLGAVELEQRGRLGVPTWLGFLGDASYSIYLLHFPLISAMARVCYRIDAKVHLPIAVWMTALVVCGAGAGCLLHVFVERPMLRWLRAPAAAATRYPLGVPATARA